MEETGTPEVEVATHTHKRGFVHKGKRGKTLKKVLQNSLPSSNSQYANKNIDIADIISLRKKGLTFPEIAKILECSMENVRWRYRRIEKEVEGMGKYKEHRADILAVHQKRILDSISQGNLSKAGLRDKVVSFGVLFDKEKVEDGKGPIGGLKIEIVNYAGASGGGEPKVTQVMVMKPQQETDEDSD